MLLKWHDTHKRHSGKKQVHHRGTLGFCAAFFYFINPFFVYSDFVWQQF
jgi:hypothetical protein